MGAYEGTYIIKYTMNNYVLSESSDLAIGFSVS